MSPQPSPTRTSPSEGVYGFVTFAGAPDVGIAVELMRTAGDQAVMVASTRTDALGIYEFQNVDDLPGGATYGVRYRNDADPERLSLWFGPDIAAYRRGDAASGGDFDTADVRLGPPVAGATVSLPATFEWTARGIEGDSYQWYLADPSSSDSWGTEPMAGATYYTVRSFSPPVRFGKEYWWHVRVHRAGGYGLSHFEKEVLFEAPTTGIAGRVTFRGAPAAGVALTLTRLQGTTWVQLGTATTAADGSYDFARAPSLPPNTQYHVQYENLDDPERLSLWLGPAVTQYGAGEAADGGSFDVADVTLQSPAYGAMVTLPTTFEWGRRGLPDDGYEWIALDPTTGQMWTSDVLGDTGSFILGRLQPAMQYDVEYWWYVRIYRQGNGSGVSFMQMPFTLGRSSGSHPAAGSRTPACVPDALATPTRAITE